MERDGARKTNRSRRSTSWWAAFAYFRRRQVAVMGVEWSGWWWWINPTNALHRTNCAQILQIQFQTQRDLPGLIECACGIWGWGGVDREAEALLTAVLKRIYRQLRERERRRPLPATVYSQSWLHPSLNKTPPGAGEQAEEQQEVHVELIWIFQKRVAGWG